MNIMTSILAVHPSRPPRSTRALGRLSVPQARMYAIQAAVPDKDNPRWGHVALSRSRTRRIRSVLVDDDICMLAFPSRASHITSLTRAIIPTPSSPVPR